MSICGSKICEGDLKLRDDRIATLEAKLERAKEALQFAANRIEEWNRAKDKAQWDAAKGLLDARDTCDRLLAEMGKEWATT